MRTVDEILARAEQEIIAGRAWRAKEVLRGTLATRAEPKLLERYGRLLEALGERYEAGKYLFLSGARSPQYRETIDLFLVRTAARKDRDFVQLFPTAVRHLPFAQLAPAVQEELRRRDVKESWFTGASPIVPPAKYTLKDRAVMVVGVLIMLIFVLALGLGIAQIVNWVWRLGR